MRKDDGLSNNWCFSLIFRLGIGKTTKTKVNVNTGFRVNCLVKMSKETAGFYFIFRLKS